MSKPAKPDAALRSLDPRLGAILRIAGDLRDLPRAEFKSNLKTRLASRALGAAPAVSRPVGGKPLVTEQDIYQRIKEMADEPRLVAHDVNAALDGLPPMSMKFLEQANRTTLVVSRATGASWERHPGGDEMIYVVEGAAELVTLTEDGPVKSKLREGSLFVCPRGLWHQTVPKPSVAAFYLTPGEGTENSRVDPRGKAAGKRVRATGKREPRMPRLEVHDLRAALREVPHLTITESTTGEEADAAVRTVAKLDELTLGVMSYSGQTPWERHPGGDELLFALDGEVEVTVLTDDGPVHETIRKGSAFVCPRGLWHRQLARKSVSMLYGTATETSEVSFAEDPREAKPEQVAEAIAPARRGIMPFMYVEGAGRAADFYKQVFGATELMRELDADGIVSHAQLKVGDTTIMLSDPTARHILESESKGLYRSPHGYGGSSVHLYVYVADVDTVFKRAIEAGAKVIDPVEDKEWGDRCGGIEDPFGHVWFVATPRGAQAQRK